MVIFYCFNFENKLKLFHVSKKGDVIMSIIEETALRNWLESIKPIISKEDCSFLTSLIDGTETILKTSYSEEKIKSFLENIPLYHEVAKYNLYNYLIENFNNIKASFGFYDLDIVEKKNEV